MTLAGRISESLDELDPNENIKVTSAEIAGGFSAFFLALAFGTTGKVFSNACPCIAKNVIESKNEKSNANNGSEFSETEAKSYKKPKADERRKQTNC